MIPSNLISAASFTPDSLQFPNAWVEHLPFTAWLVKEISPIGLGAHSGNFYFHSANQLSKRDLK